MLVEFANEKCPLGEGGSPALSYWIKFEHRLFGYRG
jgi:hypothetical protein